MILIAWTRHTHPFRRVHIPCAVCPPIYKYCMEDVIWSPELLHIQMFTIAFQTSYPRLRHYITHLNTTPSVPILIRHYITHLNSTPSVPILQLWCNSIYWTYPTWEQVFVRNSKVGAMHISNVCDERLLLEVLCHMTVSTPPISSMSHRGELFQRLHVMEWVDAATTDSTLRVKCEEACAGYLELQMSWFTFGYFQMLGFTDLAYPASASLGGSPKPQRVAQTAEAYNKLYVQDSKGLPNCSRWRTAPLAEICNAQQCPNMPSYEVDGVDILFRNTPARASFKSFRGSASLSNNGEPHNATVSLRSLIRADAAMTLFLERLGHEARAYESNTPVLPNSAGRFESLLCLSAHQLFESCRSTLVHYIRGLANNETEQEQLLAAELGLSTRSGGTHCEVLCTRERAHTSACFYASTNSIYISLLPKTFRKHICGWLGVVQDCYICYYNTELNKGYGFVVSERESISWMFCTYCTLHMWGMVHVVV